MTYPRNLIQNQSNPLRRIYLGGETTVPGERILGIFDMDTATVSPVTRKFLSRAQRAGNVKNVSDDLPKSFVLTDTPDGTGGGKDECVYLAQPAPATLVGRA